MKHILAIAAGGSVGAILRYLVSAGCARWLGSNFAFGTLAVNVLGCFLIGLLIPLGTGDIPKWHPVAHSALTVGFLGALTTFSTFGFETTRFFENGDHGFALLNVGANMLLGLVAVYGGLQLGRWLAG